MQIEFHVEREQGHFRAGLRRHPEWHWNRYAEVVIGIVAIDLPVQEALLRALQHKDHPWSIENRNVLQNGFRPQDTHANQGRGIVSRARCEL